MLCGCRQLAICSLIRRRDLSGRRGSREGAAVHLGEAISRLRGPPCRRGRFWLRFAWIRIGAGGSAQGVEGVGCAHHSRQEARSNRPVAIVGGNEQPTCYDKRHYAKPVGDSKHAWFVERQRHEEKRTGRQVKKHNSCQRQEQASRSGIALSVEQDDERLRQQSTKRKHTSEARLPRATLRE